MPSRQHIPYVCLLAALAVLWTWPLARHFADAVPGTPGDNFSFLWNLWWARHTLEFSQPFFHSPYLFSPFGVDLVNHPHTLLQGLISATVLAKFSIVEAENLYIIVSVFANAAAAYALTYEISKRARLALLAAIAFGQSPYIAAHLLGHFDLLSAWVLPLFALYFRRAVLRGRWIDAVAGGLCVAVAAYTAYYYVVYQALFALAYTIACWSEGSGVTFAPRGEESPNAFTVRLLAIALISLDLFLIVWIWMTGGLTLTVAGAAVSLRGFQNPMLVLWVLAMVWCGARWAVRVRTVRPSPDVLWRGVQALMITAAVFAIASLPLIVQAFRLIVSGRYVSQTYFWRSAPRGVDVTSFLTGNPFHPLIGGIVSRLYAAFGLNPIEQVAWIGLVPLLVLFTGRGQWSDGAEARRWKVVLGVFLLWAVGPFLMLFGHDLGLPLPETLARFVPFVDNARVPGRAMVVVYLAVGVLMAQRLTAPGRANAAYSWGCIALLSCDFLSAPVPMTVLDRPAIYQTLADIKDDAPMIEVPFGIGDGLSVGIGSQERRILYYATIHQHPLVGGYIGRMPPGVARAYQSMPVVGNLLRLSSGESAVEEADVPAVPFRYLVLDTTKASPELTAYVHATLDLDLIAREAGRELYAVQGTRPPERRASR